MCWIVVKPPFYWLLHVAAGAEEFLGTISTSSAVPCVYSFLYTDIKIRTFIYLINRLWGKIVKDFEIRKKKLLTLLSSTIFHGSLMGFRTHYHKIWHLGTLNILSWRNLRDGVCRKDFLTLLWSSLWNPYVRSALPVLGKEHPYLQDSKWNLNRPCCLPQFSILSSYPIFVLSHFSTTLYPSSNLALKHSGMGLPWWHSGWESTCQCRGHTFEPWSGKIPHALEQLSPWATTTKPVL